MKTTTRYTQRITEQGVVVLQTVSFISLLFISVNASSNDTDGCDYSDAHLYDGWGWNPVTLQSCAPVTTSAGCDYSQQHLYGGWGWNPVTMQSCAPLNEPAVSNCVDTDGDGWGWNGVESCRVNEGSVDNKLQVIQLAGVAAFFDYYPNSDSSLISFQSYESNLHANDSGRYSDVFVLDSNNNSIKLVSNGSNGEEANNRTFLQDVSSDGNAILIQSYATNLPGMSGNGTGQLYIYDVPSGQFTAVATGIDGRIPWSNLNHGHLSDDGNIVVYSSLASNIVTDDSNQASDIFLFDASTSSTERVNLNSEGEELNARSTLKDVSGDGQFVVFVSEATNLGENGVYGYTIYRYDHRAGMVEAIRQVQSSVDVSISDDGNIIVYQYQRSTGVTLHWHNVSTGATGAVYSDPGNGYSSDPQVSADGRYVTFLSDKTGLVSDVATSGDRAQLYLTDLVVGNTVMVSKSADNEEANGYVTQGEFVGGGRYLRFASHASNLYSGDGNNSIDTFVFEMPTQ